MHQTSNIDETAWHLSQTAGLMTQTISDASLSSTLLSPVAGAGDCLNGLASLARAHRPTQAWGGPRANAGISWGPAVLQPGDRGRTQLSPLKMPGLARKKHSDKTLWQSNILVNFCWVGIGRKVFSTDDHINNYLSSEKTFKTFKTSHIHYHNT